MSDEWVESVDTVMPEPVAPPVAVAPVAEPAAPEPGPDSDEEKEGPDAETERVRDAKGRWRNRAKSQQAGPDDVPRIKELTRRLRQTEEQLQQVLAKSAPPAEVKPLVPAYQPPPQMQASFTEPEPTLEQFADKDDPYGAWQRALAKWDRKQEAAEAAATQQQAQFQRQTQQTQQYWDGVRLGHQQKLVAAVQANPQVAQVLQSVQVQPPPLLDLSIMLDSNSVDVALFLAKNPSVLDEFALMTAVQPVTEQNVAATQRLLRQRMSAVGSGSVASSPVLPPAPRPPNPLRTAPMKTGEALPGDDDSLEAHEKAFPIHGRRRR